jgi:hypothetical protein
MILQQIATLLTVLWALSLVLRRLPWFRPAAGTGCGSCQGCGSGEKTVGVTQVPLVQLGTGPLHDLKPRA